HSAIACCDLFVRVKREDSGGTARRGLPPAIFSAVRFAAVGDDRQPVTARDRGDDVVIGWLTEHVDGKNRSRSRGDRGFNQIRVYVVCVRLDVDEDRYGA